MEEAEKKLGLITKYFGDFSPAQLQQFAALEGLYNEWNSQINVISRKDMESLYEKHVLHSLSIAAAFEFQPGQQIVDLGTGGGFPGIPLAIFFPEVKFHLVDSIGKKIKVVEAVAEGLGLKNVTAQHTRVEDIKNRKFDFVVSRAVAPLKDLWHWSKPLLKKNPPGEGIKPGLICLKGGDLTAEIAESGCKPRIMEVKELFNEEYFKEKYLLYVRQ
ncbi:16S rRNA (guanine(527)-N(7))-methyltransferase RsmG [Pseudoflavitalea sp. G-6-1-2]|uniref:16S rRNA (guanine(527)-N(7))-methyltransferase RsmG n=1 Tax=Pseudoflavitalea sp. G-6-1-2 TaxID=2728841 RepID=UPI00146B87A5|nr:16S rRNA (guanine(527)-N(7))-methyltransferase RsmG [Pseudoflavitalea sp. G-6-1-2]NML20687.1 16S rRNA (guanine(527)-N(7))-methyltransferase RsmG [Pseudoflavitalea sp. G-6-1-2]